MGASVHGLTNGLLSLFLSQRGASGTYAWGTCTLSKAAFMGNVECIARLLWVAAAVAVGRDVKFAVA